MAVIFIAPALPALELTASAAPSLFRLACLIKVTSFNSRT
jgi:hypothetical protein